MRQSEILKSKLSLCANKVKTNPVFNKASDYEKLTQFLYLLRGEYENKIFTKQEFIDNSQYNNSSIKVLITTKNNNFANYVRKYGYFNGVVIQISFSSDEIDTKILAIPEKYPEVKNFIKNINLKNYSIYPIVDGSALTLYYDENKWTLSSKNGYDLNDIGWRSETQFKSALNEVVANENFYNLLNKNYCYNLILVNKKFHPFNKENKIYLISAIDMKTFEKKNIRDENINLGLFSLFDEISSEISLADMLKQNKKAFGNFMKRGVINFGYVFKSKADNFNDIILESSLMISIRRAIYNYEYSSNPEVRIKESEYFRDFDFVATKAYLNERYFNKFMILFPDYSFSPILKFMDKLVENIINCIIKKKELPANYSGLIQREFKYNINYKINSKAEREIMKDIIINLLRNKKILIPFYEDWKLSKDKKNSQ